VCAPVHVCVCVCVCVWMCVRMCVHVVRLQHACIPVNFISCITTECKCSANCTILWGQTKVCKFCMAASCSCAPLPFAQPGPPCLLQAGGGWRCRRSGGASSPLVTLNNNYFQLPPPKDLNRSLEIYIYFTIVSPVLCHHPLQKTTIRGGDILYVR
jgi:hypothetical protein